MNTISTPGFSAEASLYRTSGRHRTAETFSHAGGTIQPAFGRNDCYWDCLSNCDDHSYYCSVNCRCYCMGGPPRCQYR
jgi:hypothetical protein